MLLKPIKNEINTIPRLNSECLINFELHTIISKELKLFVFNIVSIL